MMIAWSRRVVCCAVIVVMVSWYQLKCHNTYFDLVHCCCLAANSLLALHASLKYLKCNVFLFQTNSALICLHLFILFLFVSLFSFLAACLHFALKLFTKRCCMSWESWVFMLRCNIFYFNNTKYYTFFCIFSSHIRFHFWATSNKTLKESYVDMIQIHNYIRWDIFLC